jgi:hypothetical protein
MMGSRGNWPKPLLAMVEASHSRAAMEQVRDHASSDADFDALVETATEMLRVCAPEGSACVLLSALLAETLSPRLGITIPVVAGSLKLGSRYMYGGDKGFDGARVFSEGTTDWDGHCWLLFGDYIVDASLGRTARRGDCSPELSRAVIRTFGPNVGLIAVTESNARAAGLRYLPRYVLTPDQVLASAGGAIQRFGL